MRSIKRRYRELQRKNPDLSDYMNLIRAIKNQKFSKDIISRWFNKLINESEYDRKDKRDLIAHLVKLSNTHEDNRN